LDLLPYSSLPSLYLANCGRFDFMGWYQRKGNQWIHFAPEDLKNKLFYLSLALNKRGLSQGKSLGIVAHSSPNWVIADVAAQVCHAITVPLFPNISSENFLFQCEDSNVEILMIDNVTALDKPLRCILDRFKLVICISSKSKCLGSNGVHWETLLQEGKELAQEPGALSWFEKQIESIHPDDIFSIIYTSGSTGRPKGAELTHRNMLSQLPSIFKLYPLRSDVDSALTFLPIAHVFERMTIYYYLFLGLKVYFADDPKNAALLLQEVKPSMMTVVPRILERLYEKMTAAADSAVGPKKWIMHQAIRLAKIEDPKKPSLLRKIYEPLVYSKMRAAIGDNFKLVISGSSPLNKSIIRFLMNIGLPIYEGYGLTECSPVVSANFTDHWKIGSVGLPLPHLSVKIGPGDEVLVKGDSVFHGYHNLPKINEASFTEDGYFRTGDQGIIDKEGYLFIIGRIKEMLKTSTGKYVSPLPIELELTRHPLIEGALVIANNRKFASALLFLNHENARRLLSLSDKGFDPSIAAHHSERITEAIARHVRNINKKLSHWEEIQKWVIIPDELTIESGLLTPTLKLRRKTTEARYAKEIETLYQ